jgi:hypothetical protein
MEQPKRFRLQFSAAIVPSKYYYNFYQKDGKLYYDDLKYISGLGTSMEAFSLSLGYGIILFKIYYHSLFWTSLQQMVFISCLHKARNHTFEYRKF